MRNIATWMRRKDEKYFAPFFARYPDVKLWNAARRKVPLDQMQGLLLTGGPDIAPEFLHQPVPDSSVLDKDMDPPRDRWEFEAVKEVLDRTVPILGGTLHLDIPGHNLPELKTHDLQPLKSERNARHRFEKVNSSHHQSLDRLGDGIEVESWCATDDVIEQVKLRDYPFALAVQYHPERGTIYDALFDDFMSRVGNSLSVEGLKR